MAGDVRDLLRSQRVVERDRCGPGVQRAQVRDQVLGTVLRHDRHEVAPAHPEGTKAHGGLGHPLAVLAPREAPPRPALLPGDGGLLAVALRVLQEEVPDRPSLDEGVDLGPLCQRLLRPHRFP